MSYEIARFPPAEDTCVAPVEKGSRVSAGDELFLYVTVKDSGPGLAPKELALLFQRFSQSNKMIHTRYGGWSYESLKLALSLTYHLGSGLGLFICRSKFSIDFDWIPIE